MIIALARHGETDYNVAKRFQGQTEVPLNARGIEQAHDLAAEAAAHEWGSLYCSPLARAQQTAEIVGARIGLTPIADARFKETDTGDWTDLTHDDVRAKDPEGFAALRARRLGLRLPRRRVARAAARARGRRARRGHPVPAACRRWWSATAVSSASPCATRRSAASTCSWRSRCPTARWCLCERCAADGPRGLRRTRSGDLRSVLRRAEPQERARPSCSSSGATRSSHRTATAGSTERGSASSCARPTT